MELEKLISLFEELNLLKEPSLFFRVNPHWVSIFLMKFSNNMHWGKSEFSGFTPCISLRVITVNIRFKWPFKNYFVFNNPFWLTVTVMVGSRYATVRYATVTVWSFKRKIHCTLDYKHTVNINFCFLIFCSSLSKRS